MAAKKKTTPASMDLIVAELKKNPNADYASIKAKADKKGITVYPIMYGRAQLMLGLVSRKKKGGAKKAGRKPGQPASINGRRRGRPATANAGGALDQLQSVVDQMKSQERDNAELRATLAKIRELISAVA